MKIRHYLLIMATLATHNLTADTFVLKSGVKYDGKILSEDAQSYLIEVRVTSSIKDQRRIPKEQIQKIIKEEAGAQDFSKVKPLVPTPDRLSLPAYAKRIKTAKDFLTKFPKTTHLKEVSSIIQLLEKEQKAITQGGLKLDGELISATDMKANAYDIHARILLHDVKRLLAERNYQQALRKWETLKNNYAHAVAYKNSIPIAKRALKLHRSQLSSLIESLEAREEKRKLALGSLKQGDLERTVKLLAERKKTYETLIEKEKKELRTRWLTIDPFHKKSMDFNLSNAKSELNNLASYDPAKFAPAGPAYRGAWNSLAKNDLEKAAKFIQTLQQLQLPEKYTAPFAKQLTEKQATQAAEKKAAEERAKQEDIAKAKAAKEAAEAKKKGDKKLSPQKAP